MMRAILAASLLALLAGCVRVAPVEPPGPHDATPWVAIESLEANGPLDTKPWVVCNGGLR